jgi:hypothetical protein
VVELLVIMALGLLVMAAGLAVLFSTRTAEDRTWLKADAAEQAVRAQLWLERDLATLARDPAAEELAPPVPYAGEDGTELAFASRARDGAKAVAWRFDPGSGVLVRKVQTRTSMRFALGKGSQVRFAVVDPGFAHGKAPKPGEFGNRVSYRITSGAEHGRGRQAITLVGSVTLVVKASRDTFPFWSKGAPMPELPKGGPS